MRKPVSAGEVIAALVLSGALVAVHAMGHDESVEAVAIALVVTGVLGTPLLTLAHELGHAVTAVALTRRPVLIRMGDDKRAVLRCSTGSIFMRLSPIGHLAHCELPVAPIAPRRLATIALAGPATSLAVGLALTGATIAIGADSPVAFWIGALSGECSLLLGAANALPFRRLPPWWPGALGTEGRDDGPSDGWLALAAIRHMRAHGPEAHIEFGADSRRRFEHVTERARQIVVSAQAEARALGSDRIGTEHLLLGLLRDGDGLAARALSAEGARAQLVRAQANRIADGQPLSASSQLPLSPAARRALERAPRMLSLQGDPSVDTEHMLLGLLQEPEAAASHVLRAIDVDPAALRRRVMSGMQNRLSPALS